MRIEWSEKENKGQKPLTFRPVSRVVINPCCKAMDKLHKWAIEGVPTIDSDYCFVAGGFVLIDGHNTFIIKYCPWCGKKIDKENHG